jgi:hypothetical protein
MCNWEQFQTRNAAASQDRLAISPCCGVLRVRTTLDPIPTRTRFANVRFLPEHSERNVEGDGESLLALDIHPESARRAPVTINERTLADSFWPILKRTGLAEGRDIGGALNRTLCAPSRACAFVQENAPERVDVKRYLAKISAAAPADSLIATSSSGSDRPPVVSPRCECL